MLALVVVADRVFKKTHIQVLRFKKKIGAATRMCSTNHLIIFTISYNF